MRILILNPPHESPSPLRGGVRGGGNARSVIPAFELFVAKAKNEKLAFVEPHKFRPDFHPTPNPSPSKGRGAIPLRTRMSEFNA